MHHTALQPSAFGDAALPLPCLSHQPGQHLDACRTSGCGFCGRQIIDLLECRACLRLVCDRCCSGYLAGLGPICGPCTPAPACETAGAGTEVYRLCVFELDLSCGHLVTAALTGWYPVHVACCDRLGGTISGGVYVPYSSEVDYVRVLSERYETRPAGTPPGGTRIIGRRDRTDPPCLSPLPAGSGSAGRLPAYVGAVWSFDGSIAVCDLDWSPRRQGNRQRHQPTAALYGHARRAWHVLVDLIVV